MPHHIQALGEGVEFLLVFDDGMFSENSTFMISDYFAHTPRSVLAKNFGWSPEQLANMPEREKYIFNGQVPPAAGIRQGGQPDRRRAADVQAPHARPEAGTFPGGSARVADSTNFTAATTISAALVEIEPGGLRELHWHPTDDEWQYYISGTGRMGVFASSG